MKKKFIVLLIGFGVVGAAKTVKDIGIEAVEEFARRQRERGRQEGVEKTVDDFVKAVVFNRVVTIESKHNGSVTIKYVE